MLLELSGSYYNDADAWARQSESLVILPSVSEVLAPPISFDGLEFIQVETENINASGWGRVDGGIQSDEEFFVGVSESVELVNGQLLLNDTVLATFNNNVHLEPGAYGMLLTDG